MFAETIFQSCLRSIKLAFNLARTIEMPVFTFAIVRWDPCQAGSPEQGKVSLLFASLLVSSYLIW